MADTKVSALPAATSLALADEFLVNQSATSKKVSLTVLQQYVNASSATYLTGSGILIPASGLLAGQVYRWYIGVTKTAAGTATPIWTFRTGAARTTADATILTITGTAQVATASGTLIIITCHIRAVGSGTSGLVVGSINTGAASFGIGGNAVSSGYANNADAGEYMGLAVNTGAAAAWTVNSVMGELT
jgi:hypothetical protein